MKRIEWIRFLLAGALLLALPRAEAQQAEKVWRVGFLGSRNATDPSYPHFAAGMRELGYSEGKNLTIEWRYADGDYTRLPGLARELVGLGLDVLVAEGSPGIRAAQGATTTIPIIFAGGADVVGSGFVKSLSRPGGNTTGASLLLNDTTGKQLELLAAMVPKVSRVAVLYNPANEVAVSLFKGVERDSKKARLEVIPLQAREAKDIEAAVSLAASERAHALLWIIDSFLIQQQAAIAESCKRHRLPSVTGHPAFPEAGGLLGYGPNRRDLWRVVASYVDKVWKGANPGDLPVQQPMKLDLVINRKTASQLGLEIPGELLVLADKVIE